ncbi:T9SS type A sorting domain-containing protein [Hymenobacter aquaticus]|nr:T9SS type A sorting domain-containing protein [Hymenobacter aquaticus]
MRNYYVRPLGIFLLCLLLSGAHATQGQARLKPAARQPLSDLLPARRGGQHPPAAAARTATAAQLPTRVMMYTWNPVDNAWDFPYLSSYTYDAAGRVTQTLSGDSIQGPGGVDRDQLTFDARGNLVEQLIQQRDTTSLPWTNWLRTTQVYDAHDTPTLVVDQVWTNNAWETYGGYRATNSYTPLGTLSEEVLETWQQGTYKPSVRKLYTTDAAGQWTSITGQQYRNGGWVNKDRISNLVWHDWAANQPASYAEQTWNGSAWETSSLTRATWLPNNSFQSWEQFQINGQWQDFSRKVVTYDELGNLLVDTWEQLDANGQWALERGDKTAVVYNLARTATLASFSERYEPVVSSYVKSEKRRYSGFVPLATRAKVVPGATVELYPNPAVTSVTVTVAAAAASVVPVQVLNSLGQVVRHGQARPQQGGLTATLDVAALPAGVYTVRLLLPEGPVMRQLIRR